MSVHLTKDFTVHNTTRCLLVGIAGNWVRDVSLIRKVVVGEVRAFNFDSTHPALCIASNDKKTNKAIVFYTSALERASSS